MTSNRTKRKQKKPMGRIKQNDETLWHNDRTVRVTTRDWPVGVFKKSGLPPTETTQQVITRFTRVDDFKTAVASLAPPEPKPTRD